MPCSSDCDKCQAFVLDRPSTHLEEKRRQFQILHINVATSGFMLKNTDITEQGTDSISSTLCHGFRFGHIPIHNRYVLLQSNLSLIWHKRNAIFLESLTSYKMSHASNDNRSTKKTFLPRAVGT